MLSSKAPVPGDRHQPPSCHVLRSRGKSSNKGRRRQPVFPGEVFRMMISAWNSANNCHWVLGIATPRVRSHLPSSNIPLFFAAALEELFSKKSTLGSKLGPMPTRFVSFSCLLSRACSINYDKSELTLTSYYPVTKHSSQALSFVDVWNHCACHSTALDMPRVVVKQRWKKRKHLQKSCCCFN